MKRKVYRNEVQSTVANLLDLGFTVAAIAFMLNMTTANIYTHLKNAKRMKGRVFTPQCPRSMPDATQASLRRLFREPRWINLDMMAQTLSGATPPGGETKSTSGKSVRKGA